MSTRDFFAGTTKEGRIKVVLLRRNLSFQHSTVRLVTGPNMSFIVFFSQNSSIWRESSVDASSDSFKGKKMEFGVMHARLSNVFFPNPSVLGLTVI
jgi:hypothetical protein